MAELEGYESVATKVASPVSIATPALDEASNAHMKLADKLSQFSSYMFEKQREVSIDKAKKDAINDSIQGKADFSKSVYTAYGKAYSDMASATYAADADLRISKKSQELELAFERDPAGYSSAMKNYIDEMTQNAPTPELQSVIDISGTKLRNATFGKIQMYAHKMEQEEQLVTFSESWDMNLSRIINVLSEDPLSRSGVAQQKNFLEVASKEANVLIAQQKTYLDTAVAQGLLDPATAKTMEYESKYQINHGVSVRHLQSLLAKENLKEAADYADSQTKEFRTDMSVKQNEAHQSKIRTMYNNEIKRRKALTKAEADHSTSLLNDFTDIIQNGGDVKNTAVLKKAFEGASDAAKYNYKKATTVRKITDRYEAFSLEQQENILSQQKAKKDRTIVEDEVIEWLDAHIKTRRAAYNNDPVGTAIKEGKIEYTSMSPEQGIDGLIDGLMDMEVGIKTIQETAGVSATNLLTNQDAKAWSVHLNNATSKEQIDFITNIAVNRPQQAKTVFRQVAGKDAPLFGFVANLTLAGNPVAAEIAIKGRNSGVSLDNLGEFKKDINSLISGVWSHDKQGKILKRDMDGMLNYNKGIIANGGAQLGASDVLEQTFGTVETYNDKAVIIPRGVSSDQFENWFTNLHSFIDNSLADEIADMDSWFGAKTIQLHQAGDGKYKVFRSVNGKGAYVSDRFDPTKPLILDYYKSQKSQFFEKLDD